MRFVLPFILLFMFCEIATAQVETDYVSKGKALMQKGKYKDAIGLFTEALAKDDHNAQYYYNRGMAYDHEKKYADAYLDFTKAIHYNEKYAEAYSERAEILFLGRQFQESLNDLDMAIKCSPSDSLQYRYTLKRGGIRLAVRNYKGAYEDCKIFYDHDSTNIPAMVDMALAKLELNEPNVALGYLFKVLASHPQDTIALLNIGYVNIRMERFDSALVYLERSRALDPKNAYTLSNLAYAKLKLGDPDGAMKSVNASLKLYPENSYAFRNRALIYLKMKDTLSACQDLHTAVRLGFTEQYGREVQDLIEDNCLKKK